MRAAWMGNELIDSVTGATLASVQSDVLIADGTSMLIERTTGRGRFRARGTTTTGTVGTVGQEGLTVQRLAASCSGRDYELVRRSLWRKDRIIVRAGARVGTVEPMISGKVVVEWDDAVSPLLDCAFLTWACVLVDSPIRQPRI